MRNKEELQPTKEQLIQEGKVKNFKTEIFEEGKHPKGVVKYGIFQGCKFINYDFSAAEFVECDFRWASFENCKGIDLVASEFSPIHLPKLNCTSANFKDCDFTEARIVEPKVKEIKK